MCIECPYTSLVNHTEEGGLIHETMIVATPTTNILGACGLVNSRSPARNDNIINLPMVNGHQWYYFLN